MASDRRPAAPLAFVALAALLAVGACGDLGEEDILGALAASPPATDDGHLDTDSRCVPACEDDRTCVRGACVALGDDEDCEPACDFDACEVCDLSSGAAPFCTPFCDASLCETCDGEGGCVSRCDDDDEVCVEGACVASSGGACANATDLAFFSANPDYNATEHALFCGLNECDTDRGCIAACMADGREDPLGRGPSEGCARCYAEGVVCLAENCAIPCADFLDAPSCVICTETECLDDFCDCAGTEVDPRCLAFD